MTTEELMKEAFKRDEHFKKINERLLEKKEELEIAKNCAESVMEKAKENK